MDTISFQSGPNGPSSHYTNFLVPLRSKESVKTKSLQSCRWSPIIIHLFVLQKKTPDVSKMSAKLFLLCDRLIPARSSYSPRDIVVMEVLYNTILSTDYFWNVISNTLFIFRRDYHIIQGWLINWGCRIKWSFFIVPNFAFGQHKQNLETLWFLTKVCSFIREGQQWDFQ